MTERKYADILVELEEAKRERAEADGAIKELMSQLREEPGVKTLDDARALVKKLKAKQVRESQEADAEYARLLQEKDKKRG